MNMCDMSYRYEEINVGEHFVLCYFCSCKVLARGFPRNMDSKNEFYGL